MTRLHIRAQDINPTSGYINIDAEKIDALHWIQFRYNADSSYSLHIRVGAKDPSKNTEYDFLGPYGLGAVEAFLPKLQNMFNLSSEDLAFLFSTLYSILPENVFSDYLREVLKQNRIETALVMIMSRSKEQQGQLLYQIGTQYRDQGRPDIAKKFYERVSIWQHRNYYYGVLTIRTEMHFQSATVHNTAWFLEALALGEQAIPQFNTEIMRKVLSDCDFSELTSLVFEEPHRFKFKLLIHVAQLIMACDQPSMACQWFGLIASNSLKEKAEVCGKFLHDTGCALLKDEQLVLGKQFLEAIPESVKHYYAEARNILAQLHFKHATVYDSEWFFNALASGNEATSLFNQGIIEQVLSSKNPDELTQNAFANPFDHQLLLCIAKLILECKQKELACQWFTRIAQATQVETLRVECELRLKLTRLLIDVTEHDYFASPETRLHYYQLCLSITHDESLKENLALMVNVMSEEIRAGRFALLLEHILEVSRDNQGIFFHAGLAMARTGYPLLAFCFFERIGSTSPYFQMAKRETLLLMPAIYDSLSHGELMNRILSYCLVCNRDDLATVIQANMMLLTSSGCSRITQLEDENRALKTEIKRLQGLLEKSSVTSISFWKQQPPEDVASSSMAPSPS